MRRSRRKALLLVGLLACTACGSRVKKDSAASSTTVPPGETTTAITPSGEATTTTPGSKAKATATTTAAGKGTVSSAPAATGSKAIRTSADLEPLLIRTVPAGFEQQPDDVGDTGPSDLDKAASDDGDDEDNHEGRDVLVANGFVAGYQRLWAKGVTTGEDGEPNVDEADEIVDFLYCFKTAEGAAAYMQRSVDGNEESVAPEDHVTTFTVSGIPGSKGWVGGSTEDGYGAVVLFTKGGFMVQLVMSGATTADYRGLVSALTRDQYGRL
jgi:hypothetical protein